MKYLICNLKAFKTYNEMLKYKEDILQLNYPNLIISPSNIYLSLFKNTNITLCSQNITEYQVDSITGNITPTQLKSLDVSYVLIGHYEHKKYFEENLDTILKKIKIALQNNLKVIYCLGETKEELARHVSLTILEKQIAHIFNNIPLSNFKDIIIAYEPTYLIGTNASYNIIDIESNINFIKNIIEDYYHENIKIVFGGNITLDNIKYFNHIKNLDGYIIGNSAKDPANVAKILEIMTNKNE